MICTSNALYDQIKYYLAYFYDNSITPATLEISINAGAPTLVTPEIKLYIGASPHFDYIPGQATEAVQKLVGWLGAIWVELAERKSEGKVIILFDPNNRSWNDPYVVKFRLHTSLTGRRRI